jgi:hypothetical protein
MYEIERKEKEIIIRKGTYAVFTASPDSWIVYRSDDGKMMASKLKDLTEERLLLALANVVEIKDQTNH